jgi:hypothetical protein
MNQWLVALLIDGIHNILGLLCFNYRPMHCCPLPGKDGITIASQNHVYSTMRWWWAGYCWDRNFFLRSIVYQDGKLWTMMPFQLLVPMGYLYKTVHILIVIVILIQKWFIIATSRGWAVLEVFYYVAHIATVNNKKPVPPNYILFNWKSATIIKNAYALSRCIIQVLLGYVTYQWSLHTEN